MKIERQNVESGENWEKAFTKCNDFALRMVMMMMMMLVLMRMKDEHLRTLNKYRAETKLRMERTN